MEDINIAQPDSESVTNVTSTPDAASPTPKWMIDEGIAGSGDRPEWFPEKFKTVKDAMTSLSELEKKMGSAPAEYDFGKHGEMFDKEHAAFKELQAYAKEKKIPQDVFTKMLDTFDQYESSFAPDMAAEKAKLGADADKRLEVLNNFVEANLSEAAAKALTSNLNTAETIMAMEEIRTMIMSNNANIPNGSVNANAQGSDSVASLQKEMQDNLAKYKSDAAYREDWKRRADVAGRREGYIDKSNQ